ncbi:MAG TPA: energy transducer TonB [Rhizomicrobium sp.]|nr:energy transducer TonB [Rhizomicrobium sp.]
MSPVAFVFLATIVAQATSPGNYPPKPAVSAPAAAGAPHACTDYPVPALQAAAEGSTTVAFKVTTAGTVEGGSVKTSSGNADLDNASLACTRSWQYKPAMSNGAPVEVPWQVAIKWQIRPTPPFDAISDVAYRCVQLTDAGRDEMSKAKLHTVVRVHFQKGAIASVAVVGSSGNTELDRRVSECYGRVAPAVTASLQDDQSQLLTPLPATTQ